MNEETTPPADAPDPRIIESLDEYLAWVEANSTKGVKFAYRGLGWHSDKIDDFKNMPKCKWDIDKKNPKNENDSKSDSKDKEFNLVDLQEGLIDEFIEAGHNDKGKYNLALLAEIQHSEPRTAFIDYSLNPLVALYFACQDDQPYSLIITHDIGGGGKFNKVGPLHIHEPIRWFFNQDHEDDASNQDNESDIFNQDYTGKKAEDYFNQYYTSKNIEDSFNQANKNIPWVWILPTADHPRMIAQQALFIFGNNIPNYDNHCIIEKKNKKKIKEELKKQFSIDGNMLFPDFAGRAKYIIIETKTAAFYFEQANELFQEKDYEEAVKYYDKVIELNPQLTLLALAHVGRGATKIKLEKYIEAIEDFDEAIKLNSQDADAYYNRGNVKDKLGQYEEAIEDFDKAIKLNPEYADAYLNRGTAKSSLKKYKEAIKDYDIAIELDPQNALVYYFRGVANNKLDEYKEAIKDLDEFIKIYPQLANAYIHRGVAKGRLKEYEEAIKDFDEAIKLNPQSPHIYLGRQVTKEALAQLERIKGNETRAKELEKEANADKEETEKLKNEAKADKEKAEKLKNEAMDDKRKAKELETEADDDKKTAKKLENEAKTDKEKDEDPTKK